MLPPLSVRVLRTDDAVLPLTLGAGYDLNGRCEALGNLEFLGPPKSHLTPSVVANGSLAHSPNPDAAQDLSGSLRR